MIQFKKNKGMLLTEFCCALLLMALCKTVLGSYRKIKDGKLVDESIQYVVYLTKASQSETEYNAWICGGAIVSKTFIVTSAACVEDVQHMYAISGYSKYVSGDNIDNNECTSASKKKIVFICVPRKYDFAYDPVEKWAFIDIAAVKVESPYDFSAPVLPGCSWTPNKIEINYDPIYQAPGTDAIIMGWGHAEKWRKPGDPTDYNQEDLQYSSILIMSKTECKRFYHRTPELLPIIDAYMICAMLEGNLNEKGEQITKHRKRKLRVDGCLPGHRRDDNNCEESDEFHKEKDEEVSPIRSRPGNHHKINNNQQKSIGHQNKLNNQTNKGSVITDPNEHQNHQRNENPVTTNPNNFINYVQNNPVTTNPYKQPNHQSIKSNENPVTTTLVDYEDDVITFEDIIMNVRRLVGNETNRLHYTRKAGICQNDHGGPLVTWVGRHARLIGVASVFQLDKSFSCVGPSLFTSTQCNGAFLDCIINEHDFGDPDPEDPTLRKPTRDYHEYETKPPLMMTMSKRITKPATTSRKTRLTMRHRIPHDVSIVDTGEDLVRLRTQRRSMCNQSPRQRGFDVVERTISWKHHPDGPAQNELSDKK